MTYAENLRKNERRRRYRNETPATAQQIGAAIQTLEYFFDPHSDIWRMPMPVGVGVRIASVMDHWRVLLGEYRRMRCELLASRNLASRLGRDYTMLLIKHEECLPKFACRRRLQPVVRQLLKQR